MRRITFPKKVAGMPGRPDHQPHRLDQKQSVARTKPFLGLNGRELFKVSTQDLMQVLQKSPSPSDGKEPPGRRSPETSSLSSDCHVVSREHCHGPELTRFKAIHLLALGIATGRDLAIDQAAP